MINNIIPISYMIVTLAVGFVLGLLVYSGVHKYFNLDRDPDIDPEVGVMCPNREE